MRWSETFEGAPDGSPLPPRWSVRSTGTASATVQGGAARLSANNASTICAQLQAFASPHGGELLARFSLSHTTGTWYVHVSLRGDDSISASYPPVPSRCWAIALLIGSSELYGLHYLAASVAAPVTLSQSYTSTGPWVARVRLVGRRLQARLWLESSPEPSAWMVDFELGGAPGTVVEDATDRYIGIDVECSAGATRWIDVLSVAFDDLRNT